MKNKTTRPYHNLLVYSKTGFLVPRLYYINSVNSVNSTAVFGLIHGDLPSLSYPLTPLFSTS